MHELRLSSPSSKTGDLILNLTSCTFSNRFPSNSGFMSAERHFRHEHSTERVYVASDKTRTACAHARNGWLTKNSVRLKILGSWFLSRARKDIIDMNRPYGWCGMGNALFQHPGVVQEAGSVPPAHQIQSLLKHTAGVPASRLRSFPHGNYLLRVHPLHTICASTTPHVMSLAATEGVSAICCRYQRWTARMEERRTQFSRDMELYPGLGGTCLG